jgi:transposase-like protein
MKRKRYSPPQKTTIVLELLKEEDTLPQVASRHGVHSNLLRKWRAQVLEGLPSLFSDDAKDRRALEAEHQRQLDELYAEIGRLTTQVAWLKKKSGLEPDAR